MAIYWYFVILAAVIIGVCEYLRYANRKSKKYEPLKPLKTEIRVLHIFPDYKKEDPLECKEKDILRFVVRGYTDEIELREVEIDFEKVVWKYTKGNGEIIKHKAYISLITPELKEKENEKLIFISVHYLGLFDATWIKVIK